MLGYAQDPVPPNGAKQVLKNHFKKVAQSKLARVDLRGEITGVMCAGFICQSFSVE